MPRGARYVNKAGKQSMKWIPEIRRDTHLPALITLVGQKPPPVTEQICKLISADRESYPASYAITITLFSSVFTRPHFSFDILMCLIKRSLEVKSTIYVVVSYNNILIANLLSVR